MTPTIIQAMDDQALFGRYFKDPNSWQAWRVFCAALFGLELDYSQWRIFHQCTERDCPQPDGYQEAWCVVGRRGGKSFVLALIAVYLACFRDWRQFLAPGEVGTIMVIAADRKQSRVIMRYVKGLLTSTPMLLKLMRSDTSDSVTLSNRVVIEVHTASFRTTRGYTLIAALCDEIAYWSGEDAAEPDVEILNALRPGMATIPGAMLLCASSPYARKGALWDTYRKHYGKGDSPILVWRAPTRRMNPTVPQSVIDAAMSADPAAASAEYMAVFRSDVEGFVTREVVEACVSTGVYERPPQPGVSYFAFVDPSGGSADAFTLAIAHRLDEQVLLDCVREVRPPFSPETVTLEFAQVCKSYRVTKVQGDRYAGEWPRERFKVHGIAYAVSPKVRSDLYRDLLPLLNSRRVELLDYPRLLNQLTSLERRTARSGRDTIDHPPREHDDLSNAVAGALLAAQNSNRSGLRTGFLAAPYAGSEEPRGYEVDPVTFRPLDAPERARVRWVRIPESEAPAAKGS